MIITIDVLLHILFKPVADSTCRI